MLMFDQEELTKFWEDLEGQLKGFETRPGQKKMSLQVLESLNMGKQLIVEAGTGTGKSMAYLLPAMKLADREEFRIVISTATIALQEQLINKDIPLLKQFLDHDLQVEVVKGRSNYLCIEKYNQYFGQGSLSYTTEEKKVVEWVQTTETGDRNEFQPDPEIWEKISAKSDSCLGMKCTFYDQCFVVNLKRKAEQAEILITNHHLFFSDLNLRVDSQGSLSVFPSYQAVIFDEAHHIPETATKALGREVSYAQIIKLMREIFSYLKSRVEGNERLARQVESSAAKAFNKLMDFQSNDFLLQELDSFVSLQEFRQSLIKLANHMEERALEEMERPEQPKMLASRLAKSKMDLDLILDLEEQDYISWVNVQVSDTVLATNPVSVTDLLQEYLFSDLERIIMTSATLSINGKFDYFIQRIGQSDEFWTSHITSPFNYQQQTKLFIPKEFPSPGSDQYISELVNTIKKIIETAQGRTMILFTSYSVMKQVYQSLIDLIEFPLYCQGIQAKREILEHFRNEFSSVLLATNSFREGVDIPGEALQVVVMDKLPFAVPTNPLIKARVERLEELGYNSFMNLMLPEAVLAVKQGFGRLIRHQNDCGVFVILDPRVLHKPYGKHFINSLPDIPMITDWKALMGEIASLPKNLSHTIES